MSWVKASNGHAPPGTLVGGKDGVHVPMYVARAYHEGNLIPGYLVSVYKSATVIWGGKAFQVPEYEVLTDKLSTWVTVNGSAVPANALVGGVTATGIFLYVGRVHHMNRIIPGSVQKSHGCCDVILADDKITSFATYEVLIR